MTDCAPLGPRVARTRRAPIHPPNRRRHFAARLTPAIAGSHGIICAVAAIPGRFFPAEMRGPRSALRALELAGRYLRREYALVNGAGLFNKTVFSPVGGRFRDKCYDFAHLLTSAWNSAETFRRLPPTSAKRKSC